MNQNLIALLKTDDGCKRVADTIATALGFDQAGRDAVHNLLLVHHHGDEELRMHTHRALKLYALAAQQRKQ